MAGYHFIFHFHQSEIKREVKQAIKSNPGNENIVKFSFSVNDKESIEKLSWEGDDEFILDGEMYDVISKKIENGKLIIHCISDKKETALIKKYEEISQNNPLTSSSKKSILLLKWLNGIYSPPGVQDFLIDQPRLKLSFQRNNSFISSTCSDVLTPPPQFS